MAENANNNASGSRLASLPNGKIRSANGQTLFVANYISSELEVTDLRRLKEATNPPPK